MWNKLVWTKGAHDVRISKLLVPDFYSSGKKNFPPIPFSYSLRGHAYVEHESLGLTESVVNGKGPPQDWTFPEISWLVTQLSITRSVTITTPRIFHHTVSLPDPGRWWDLTRQAIRGHTLPLTAVRSLLFPLLPLWNINLFLLLTLILSFSPFFFFTFYKRILSNFRQVQLWLIRHGENNIKWSSAGETNSPVQSLPLIELMKRKLGLPPETISIAMGIERKLCCRLWATHCSSLASELHWQCSVPGAPTHSQRGCSRLARDHWWTPRAQHSTSLSLAKPS